MSKNEDEEDGMDVLLDGQTAFTCRTRWTLEARRFSVQH